MSSITEQFSVAARTQLENQFALFNALASSAVESAEKLFALNLNTTRAGVAQTSASAKKLLEARAPQELFSLHKTDASQIEQLFDYGRALYSIAATAQNDLLQSAKSSLGKFTTTPAAADAPKLVAVTSKPAAKVAAKPADKPAAKPADSAPAAVVEVEVVSSMPVQAALIEADVIEADVVAAPATKAPAKAKAAANPKK